MDYCRACDEGYADQYDSRYMHQRKCPKYLPIEEIYGKHGWRPPWPGMEDCKCEEC
jgi:hypothetical protein